MHLIETPVAGQIKNIVNMFSNCRCNNCLFKKKKKKSFMAGKQTFLAGKFYHVTGHWRCSKNLVLNR